MLLAVEIGLALLELGHDAVRVAGRELAQQQHIVAVRPDRVGPGGVDDERAVMAGLLLKARMAVPPIGAGLADGEFVSEALAGSDAGEGDAGDAVILEGEEEAVPVDRAVLG